MQKAIATFVAGCVLLSSCTVIEITREKGPGSEGTLVINAFRTSGAERHTHGYAFQLFRAGNPLGTWVSNSTGPMVIPELKPATYTVVISGRGINPRMTNVTIAAGETATLNFYARSARHADRAEAIGSAIGDAFLYTIGAIFYCITVGIVEAALDIDDDDDDEEPEHKPRSKNTDKKRKTSCVEWLVRPNA